MFHCRNYDHNILACSCLCSTDNLNPSSRNDIYFSWHLRFSTFYHVQLGRSDADQNLYSRHYSDYSHYNYFYRMFWYRINVCYQVHRNPSVMEEKTYSTIFATFKTLLDNISDFDLWYTYLSIRFFPHSIWQRYKQKHYWLLHRIWNRSLLTSRLCSTQTFCSS